MRKLTNLLKPGKKKQTNKLIKEIDKTAQDLKLDELDDNG